MRLRRADREADGARLLSEYTPQGCPGFESPALRHHDLISFSNEKLSGTVPKQYLLFFYACFVPRVPKVRVGTKAHKIISKYCFSLQLRIFHKIYLRRSVVFHCFRKYCFSLQLRSFSLILVVVKHTKNSYIIINIMNLGNGD